MTHSPTLPRLEIPRVERLTTSIGAVVTGADLRPSAVRDTARHLRELITEHQVLFLPAQSCDEADLVSLATEFGDLAVHPLRTLLERPNTVSVIEDTADRPPAGFPWHTDLSWLETPPRFGFLQALDIPSVGGDTMWSSLTAAYRSMSPKMQRMCDELDVLHEIDQSLADSVGRLHGEDVASRLVGENPGAVHPLVRTHPDTGEASLFISPMYTSKIMDLLPSESRTVLGHLERLVEDPNLSVRWRWSVGDIVIWDEATTVHRALVDHYPHYRRMRRCTTVGGEVSRYIVSPPPG